MATNKLRAELEKLKALRGLGGCRTCGRLADGSASPRAKFVTKVTVFRTVEEDKAHKAKADAEHKKRRCPECGRLPLRIQLKSLGDKSRGGREKSRVAILNDSDRGDSDLDDPDHGDSEE